MSAGTAEELRAQVDEAHERNGTENPSQRKKEFEEEAGQAVGEMPPAPPVDPPAPPLEEMRVDGTTQLGMFDSGGKKPTSSSIRLTGGKVELVDGKAFRKGDVVRLEVVAIVREVAQRDKPDRQTGIVVDCQQKHIAEITDVRLAEALEG